MIMMHGWCRLVLLLLLLLLWRVMLLLWIVQMMAININSSLDVLLCID